MLYRTLFGVQSFLPSFGSDEGLFEQIFYHSPTAYTLIDTKGIIKNTNRAFCVLVGYKATELLGTPVQLFSESQSNSSSNRSYWEDLIQLKNFKGQVTIRHKNGKDLRHKITITQIDPSHYLLTHNDVSEEAQNLERYRYLAYHDPLTGLANRSLLEDRLNHAVKNAIRTETKLCVLFCDLNEFKQLNDDYGHLMGDCALQEISARLSSFFRTNDTIARYGGDEFVVVIESISDESILPSMLQKLEHLLKEPLESGIRLSASIGSALFPRDAMTPEHLLNIADSKMYHHKNTFYGLDQ